MLYFTRTNDQPDACIRCELCPNYCKIASGRFGVCGVRGNKKGKGIIPYHGFISALAVDPIKKKPLYHFKPGSQILSLGFTGCNLRCPFCQNWHISQSIKTGQKEPDKYTAPGEIISIALKKQSPSIAYTYSEPLVHIEYILDCMSLAREHGIANVLVTNGCINADPAEEILALTDAANVDLKCFSAETYKKILGYGAQNTFEAVLNFIVLAHKKGIHLEITTLVVPGLNDSEEELALTTEFIESIDNRIPWHLTAYHPDYRWNAPPTSPAFLFTAAEKARKKLRHVHLGNILI